ncbi:nickel insertion protein [Sporomusa acidovorans]|nr:nickel insertion protein [Sporomusa acidovorans]
MTHIDNINTDHVPYLIDQLMKKGAGNVHVINAMTKKGRQEYILLIDTPEANEYIISSYLAVELGTLGIRRINADHISFRSSIETMKASLTDEKGTVIWEDNIDIKLTKDGSGIPLAARVEYECLKAAAESIEKAGSGITFHELRERVESNALKCFKKTGFEIKVEPLPKSDKQEY